MQDGLCRGCYRTLDEIVDWAGADDRTKRMILAAVEQRRNARDPQGDLVCKA
jgi:predicted Fe-S protein YdhL (DUF1289 family)